MKILRIKIGTSCHRYSLEKTILAEEMKSSWTTRAGGVL
jgi:hypothetical protein